MAAIVVVLVLPAGTAGAQQAVQNTAPVTEPLRVGVYVSPPFVMEEDGRFTGMAIELWEMVAGVLGLATEYVEIDTVAELVEATTSGAVDVAVTNLTITRERAERLDFTHPWFDAGLRVMVHDESVAGFRDVISGLHDSGHTRAYAWIATVIVVATIFLTVFDRRFDGDFPSSWRHGFAESFYTVMSVATSGKPPSRKNKFGWMGRIWQGLWLVCGVAVLAYVTSSVTSVMTTLSLNSQINSVADLPGRRVGVFTGSVAEQYVRAAGLDGRTFAHMEDAAAALQAGRIEAIVGDAPVLEYYAHTHRGQPLGVVGPIFEPDKYGFALFHGSPLRRPISLELIGAQQSGRVEEIRSKYFGDAQ